MQRLNQLSDEFSKLRYGLSLRPVNGTRRRLQDREAGARNPSSGNAQLKAARKDEFNLAVVMCRQRIQLSQFAAEIDNKREESRHCRLQGQPSLANGFNEV